MTTTSRGFRDRVADYFRAHPRVWIPHRVFFRIGGECAWRTRISECHTQLGMTIETRTVHVYRPTPEGPRVLVRKISYRRYLPPVETVPVTVGADGQLRFAAGDGA